MKEMLAFKKQLEDVERDQEQVASETEQVEGRVPQAARRADEAARGERPRSWSSSRRRRGSEVAQAEKGVSLRSEDDFAQSRDRLRDLERALQGRDFDAALQSVRRALAPVQRLAVGLHDDAFIAERYPQLQDPGSARRPRGAAPRDGGAPARAPGEGRAGADVPGSAHRAAGARSSRSWASWPSARASSSSRPASCSRSSQELAQKAPVFPPQAGEMLGGSQRHMQRAQGELAQRNPQRGHGEQRQALGRSGALQGAGSRRWRRTRRAAAGAGEDSRSRSAQDSGGREGDGFEASREKVEIPGADQYKVPDEFRKDLLEAMKQGAPEPYKGEVKRYYEELVK